jgi:hypothetical protein
MLPSKAILEGRRKGSQRVTNLLLTRSWRLISDISNDTPSRWRWVLLIFCGIQIYPLPDPLLINQLPVFLSSACVHRYSTHTYSPNEEYFHRVWQQHCHRHTAQACKYEIYIRRYACCTLSTISILIHQAPGHLSDRSMTPLGLVADPEVKNSTVL